MCSAPACEATRAAFFVFQFCDAYESRFFFVKVDPTFPYLVCTHGRIFAGFKLDKFTRRFVAPILQWRDSLGWTNMRVSDDLVNISIISQARLLAIACETSLDEIKIVH